ncbi:hypothetical protein [Krasilnikovia sp. MM14-A1259]|uniref:hypothetical protein n=1 Tax=Krasilnikovia sp. MM14-A1259 TaxID=3373539 RepID=UPI003800AA6E
MLGRRTPLLLAALVGLFAVAFAPAVAWADDGGGKVVCQKNDPRPECNIKVGTPNQPGTGGHGGNGGGTGGRGGDGKCRDPQGKEIPCQREGGWAGADGCYYKAVNLSPDMIENMGGQPAGEGGWYEKVCYNNDGTATSALGGPQWIAGAPPAVSPAVLARQASANLRLPEVTIRMNPPGDQLVNLPIWLALDSGSWKTQSATASVPAMSVTATARPATVTWAMGDGSTVNCAGPGTAWTPGTDPAKASPNCGHVYRRSSAGAPGGSYTVTATVTWEVTWSGGGESGTIPGLNTTGQVQTRVQESQAVVTR